MSGKKITEGDMEQLRAVLQGKDGTAMWEALDRLKLSPNDKVVIHKQINNSGTVRVRCGIIVPNFWLSPALQMLILYQHSYSHASVNVTCTCTHNVFVVCIHRCVLHADGNHGPRLFFLTAGQNCNVM